MRGIYWGRHVFGLAAILFGIFTLAWHDFNTWQQVGPLGDLPHREVLAYVVATIEIVAGVAIQWRRTARIAAISLGTVYSIFALLWIPRIVAQPRVYDRWGNFFEQFSQVSGALIVYSTMEPSDSERARKIARLGLISFAICVISFTLEQLFYLSGTAAFVPKWIPPGQMFWAIATTVAFALVVIALLTGHSSLLASQLLTVMIMGFGLLIWLPAPFADPHQMINWVGNAENLSIAGAAWIVTDYLRQREPSAMSLRAAA
jgi:uncharacterized membrane protein YphA (DoxX/SURF4 family)